MPAGYRAGSGLHLEALPRTTACYTVIWLLLPEETGTPVREGQAMLQLSSRGIEDELGEEAGRVSSRGNRE